LKKESKKNASASTQESGKQMSEKINDSIDELEKDGEAEEEDPAVAVATTEDEGVETHETGDESMEMDEVNGDKKDTSQGRKRQKMSE
jgi:hypothetical protein